MADVNYINLLYANVVVQIQRRRLCIASIVINKKKTNKKRRCWVSNFLCERKTYGAYYITMPALLRNPSLFRNYCRMSATLFEELCTLIAPKIRKQILCREPIPPDQRLLLTLRYLASGDSMMSLKYQFYIDQSTITNIIAETCNALWTTLVSIILKIPACNEWTKIAENFERKCNFPHCLGAVDGKHVAIQAPPNSGSTYYNYKNFHSIVLMAVCDSSYKFLLVDIGAAGRESDGGIWARCTIGKAFEAKEMDIPSPDHVFEGPILPYVLVADEAFQLTNYTMRPFPGKGSLTKEERIFNYRLSRARRMVECTFGILSSQWRIYKRPINTSIQTARNIIKATIALHNFLRENDEDNYISETMDIPTLSDNETTIFKDIGNIGSNTHTREAYNIRNRFVNYFNNEGAIPWQEMLI